MMPGVLLEYNQSSNLRTMNLSTSIYDLVLIYVCHFHHHFLQLLFFKFDHYRDTRAFILDPCIQGILFFELKNLYDIQKESSNMIM